ncbi:hypothetical protein K503DRAFT_631581 [Rhizopogon vinicolor AM-OR11-026]|uniref:Uncharacterized protein n=1 Tax=Rhizopogon vinicolor AM-OR11-026 TaxID=1314800 RepID=A0A1B7N605_9AGAM|nr:hypothetical protein K503DRAFT_631581 [Rhizopogon vinicolor AM-OR11-026]
MQGDMTPEDHTAVVGQHMEYPNSECMQQPASTVSSSVQSSSGNGKRKEKRCASDNDTVKPNAKRKNHPRLHPRLDPNLEYCGPNAKGDHMYKCVGTPIPVRPEPQRNPGTPAVIIHRCNDSSLVASESFRTHPPFIVTSYFLLFHNAIDALS